MTKYKATFEFASDAELSEVEAWFDHIAENFPDVVDIDLKQQPMVLAIEEVTDAHAGNKIRFTSVKYGQVEGTLEHVFATHNGAGRMLVVDGKSYHLNYEVVTLSEW